MKIKVQIFILLILIANSFSLADDNIKVWGDGRVRYTRTELDSAIVVHQSWLKNIESYLNQKYGVEEKDDEYYSYFYDLLYHPKDSLETTFKKSKDRLVFKGKIVGLELSNEKLNGAGFNQAIIENTVFNNLDLKATEIKGDYFGKAILNNCNLNYSRISGKLYNLSNFTETNLRNIVFISTNLQYTDFSFRDISNSKFDNADLTAAKFDKTNLKNVVYETQLHPNPRDIAYARNLENLKYERTSYYLFELKRLLKEFGFIKAEKKVNCAIKRHDSALWEFLIFDVFCEYGSNYFRPLLIDLVLWFLFSILYAKKISSSTAAMKGKRNGFYMRKQEHRLQPWDEGDFFVNMISFGPKPRLKMKFKSFCYGMLISLMSATRVGFREVNISNWLRMIFPFELDIKAQGWPRVVTGIQSVISVYLIALSLLSYFGRPFDLG